MQHFTRAIVRTPCKALIHGLTTANLGLPDYAMAMQQHAAYVEALRYCGLHVDVLPADERFPDSTFVEDVALCTPQCAIVTNPGAPSRTAERDLIYDSLSQYYEDIHLIRPPGNVEAGDIMVVGSHYYIGVSQRTNAAGAVQLMDCLGDYGMKGEVVPLQEVLHLKTGVSYLEHNNLLVCGEFVDRPIFRAFNRIEVHPSEAYAANCLWINGKVLVPQGFPRTLAQIQERGYEVVILDMSEFQKIDGGLSCLSLRF